MSLDATLWLAYIAIEAVLVGLMVYRCMGRLLAFFLAYCIWDLLSNCGGFASAHIFHSSYSGYLTIYLAETIIDSALQFGVLVELAWSVLRPIRPSLPRTSLLIIAVLILGLGALIWPFTVFSTLPHYSLEFRSVLYLQRTVSILRILVFLVIAGCSQWLSIGWRDRELQVATGLGFYSLISLAVSIVEPHLSTSAQYVRLNQFQIASFLCALLYWIASFVQKEEVRQEFTPQAQKLLLAMAGAARSTRSSLADARASGPRKPDRF